MRAFAMMPATGHRPNSPPPKKKRNAEPRQNSKYRQSVIDPLVNPGSPPHRHQARPKADPTRTHHCMVTLAQSSPGRRSTCPLQNTTTVMLALQLQFAFEVSAASVGLVGSPPERPCENAVDRDAPLSELDSDATDFLNRPADQERCLARRRGGVFLSAGSALARWRMTAIMAKASKRSDTWGCQPCQERVSL